jgi:hypothetical protein
MNSVIFAAFLLIAPVQAPVKEESYKAERIAVAVTAVTDILTTQVAIKNGANEGNKLLIPFVGRKPTTLKLVGVKLAAISVLELSAAFQKKRGQHGRAKAMYWMTAVLWGLASGFNLQFVW